MGGGLCRRRWAGCPVLTGPDRSVSAAHQLDSGEFQSPLGSGVAMSRLLPHGKCGDVTRDGSLVMVE